MKEYSESISGDGDGEVYLVRSTGHPGNEPVSFVIGGDLGGGTATFLMANDSANPVFAAIPNASFTAATADKLEMPQGTRLKFNLAGSTTPTVTLDMKGNITKV